MAVKRLDTWAKEHGVTAVDFIWADIQGAEGDLITGGKETLANTRYFYTEYSDEELYEGQPTLAQLQSMLPTFSIVRRYPMDVLFENLSFQSIKNKLPEHLVSYQNVRRNASCPCGSGKRYKHCHGSNAL